MSDTSDRRIELAEQNYAALTAGHVEEALSRLHPEIVFDWSRSNSPYAGVYEGRGAVRDLLEEIRDAFDDLEYFTEEWIEVEDRVVRVGGVRGRGRESGAEVEMKGGQLIEFSGVLPTRVTLYQTKDEALAAAGES